MSAVIQTEKIGKLGFGFMRLPRINGELDVAQVNKMVDAFLDSGGTYFDAAYVYDGAEVALRKTLIERYPRDSFQIATKLPVGMVNADRPMEHFPKTSLERLGTDYIDFYLLHGINSRANKQAEDLGLWEYLKDLKTQGVIRHIGFSFHGPPNDLDEILSKHPEVEFVMLQINYYDWDRPRVQSRLLHEISLKYNKPIVVMEPLLGGKLASGNSPIVEWLKSKNPDVSTASWALRYTAQLEGVFTTLSGMSTFEQAEDNIKTFTDLKPLSSDELESINKAIEILRGVPHIECTSCNYCKDCPSDINIPALINLYNDHLIHKTLTNLQGSYNWMTGGRGKAKDCTECKACEESCPQDLEIIDTMKKISVLFD